MRLHLRLKGGSSGEKEILCAVSTEISGEGKLLLCGCCSTVDSEGKLLCGCCSTVDSIGDSLLCGCCSTVSAGNSSELLCGFCLSDIQVTYRCLDWIGGGGGGGYADIDVHN